MTTNLQVYHCPNGLPIGDTTDLHVYLGWSKTNDNFGGVIMELMREHQGGTMDTGGTDGTPSATTATVMASSSGAGFDLDSRGSEEMRRMKKDSKSK